MKSMTMVKYTAEQIDRVLAMLASVAGDSKAYECSLPMMAVVLDINNYLRENAVISEETIADDEISPVKEEVPSNEIILSERKIPEDVSDKTLTRNEGTEEDGVILNSGDANV